MDATNWQQLAEKLLHHVKIGQPTEAIEHALETGAMESLKVALKTDDQRKAFWINIYNAYFQILVTQELVPKPDVFRKRLVYIAGTRFSLDEMEHGILRKFRYKPALGFLPNPFVRSMVKKLAVARLDYRIHFALNCGAVSCPPIAFYNAEKIDQQLDLATRSFLEPETEVVVEKKEIHVTRLMFWYFGDFGGYRGIRKVLHEKLGIKTTGMKIVFKPYNWAESLHNFAEEAMQ